MTKSEVLSMYFERKWQDSTTGVLPILNMMGADMS